MPRLIGNQDLTGLNISLNLKEAAKESRMKKCPNCGKMFDSRYAALSRKDNKTKICSDCGQEEALGDFYKYAVGKNKDIKEAETILKLNDKVKFNIDNQEIEGTISEIKPNDDNIKVKDVNGQSYDVNKGALSLVVESESEEYTFEEIISDMENAEEYSDLYAAADKIADEDLRDRVKKQIDVCETDGDDVETAYSVVTSDLLDSRINDLNEDSYEDASFAEIEQALFDAGLNPERFSDRGVLTKNIGWIVKTSDGEEQYVTCDGSYLDESHKLKKNIKEGFEEDIPSKQAKKLDLENKLNSTIDALATAADDEKESLEKEREQISQELDNLNAELDILMNNQAPVDESAKLREAINISDIYNNPMYFKTPQGQILKIELAEGAPKPEEYDEGYILGWNRGEDEAYDKEQDRKFEAATKAWEEGEVFDVTEVDNNLQTKNSIAYIYGDEELNEFIKVEELTPVKTKIVIDESAKDNLAYTKDWDKLSDAEQSVIDYFLHNFSDKAENDDDLRSNISQACSTTKKANKDKVYQFLIKYHSKDLYKDKLEEDEKIWSNTGEEDAISDMSLEELKTYAKEMYGDDYDFNGKSFDDATEEELYEFLSGSDDIYDLVVEDYEESIEPMISKQCEDDILVLFGQAANWRGSRKACEVISVDNLKSYLMPNYDAHIVLMKDNNNNLYYTESNHDTPMGGTDMYLYSFKDQKAVEDAKAKLEEIYNDGEEVNMYYFADMVDYSDLEKLIGANILTNVKVEW